MSNKLRARTVAREIARRLAVEDGDVILMKSSKTDMRTFEALRHSLAVTGREKCLIIVVDEFDDVAVMKPHEMASFGWHRIDEEE